MTNEKRKKENSCDNDEDVENTDQNCQGVSKSRLATNDSQDREGDEDSLFLSLGRRPAKHRVLVPLGLTQQESFSSPLPSPFQTDLSSPLQTLITHQTFVTPSVVQPLLSHQINAQLPSSSLTPMTHSQVFCYDPLRSPPAPPQQLSVTHLSKQVRKNPTQVPKKEGKTDIVPILYPWGTNRRATIPTFQHLMTQQILFATGEVQCKRCEQHYEVKYNIYEKFREIGSHICQYKGEMRDRAPTYWMNPTLLTCPFCHQEKSVKPVVADKKKAINWLFLFLGQMLGCCSLEQLKYFCKHTKNHRTGAKNRVLYLTYLGLCKQLDPTGPFDR